MYLISINKRAREESGGFVLVNDEKPHVCQTWFLREDKCKKTFPHWPSSGTLSPGQGEKNELIFSTMEGIDFL